MNFRNQEKHCVNTALTMRVNACNVSKLIAKAYVAERLSAGK